MSEDAHAGHGHDIRGLERETAPQQEYSMGQVWVGLFVLFVGVAVTFGVPLVFG